MIRWDIVWFIVKLWLFVFSGIAATFGLIVFLTHFLGDLAFLAVIGIFFVGFVSALMYAGLANE